MRETEFYVEWIFYPMKIKATCIILHVIGRLVDIFSKAVRNRALRDCGAIPVVGSGFQL